MSFVFEYKITSHLLTIAKKSGLHPQVLRVYLIYIWNFIFYVYNCTLIKCKRESIFVKSITETYEIKSNILQRNRKNMNIFADQHYTRHIACCEVQNTFFSTYFRLYHNE
jgi:hypothetical protein